MRAVRAADVLMAVVVAWIVASALIAIGGAVGGADRPLAVPAEMTPAPLS